ncbi:methyltransferase N6AMT1 [Drosophila sulfurigaster albostrigata]|uniref:methyltransferase N6AMT1 n=1 Tax=Drosophila sulfurigaster albostrigata TaxID=89887 RepID=UPI002D21C53D|nr:methyltransferase N6AMT1 [Drosophila sulfurigaster albostrigata]
METPHTQHLSAADFEHVYEPAEDSFLLLDALEADLPFLDSLQPRLCVELGSGSGVIITALAKRLAHSSICLATDINPHACDATKRTAFHNGARLDSVRCNLADALRPRSVDVLLFNPPYVVTSDEEQQQSSEMLVDNPLVYSWAGGKDGRRVTDILLQQLDDILSPRGVLYLLLLRENKPDEIIELLVKLGFKAVKCMERRIPGEYLYILKVTRSNN